MKKCRGILSVLGAFWFLINAVHGMADDRRETGIQVRKVFIELLDATDPILSTEEKKQKIINTLLNRKDILKELFFKSNREVWDNANFRIDYDQVKDRLQLGPFTSLLFYKKQENDVNQALIQFNQMTYNVFPSAMKMVIDRVPPLPYPVGVGFINFPGVKQATDHEVEVLAFGINQFIVNFRLNDSNLIQEILTPPQGFDLQQLPEGFREKFMDGLQDFVNHFPLDRKRKMARALLELPPDASIGKMIASSSVHAGPLFVKLLQLIQNYSPVEMQTELKVLLDGLPPHLSEAEIRQILDENVPQEVRDRMISFDYQPLSVASLGQVHKMVLRLPSGEIVDAVVKFIAPKFRKMIDEDLQSLEQVMGGFKFGRKLVTSLKKVMEEELDLRTEAAYTMAGAKVYRDSNRGIDVVDILQGEAFPLTPFMEAQTFAKGIPLSKMNDEMISKTGIQKAEFNIYLAKALISYLKTWFRNAVFENYHLAHADSHKGNLFFKIEKGNPASIRPYRLTVIDFGSMCKMTQEEAKAMVLVSQGLFLSQSSAIVKGFYQLSLIANEGKEDPNEMEKLRKLRDFIEQSQGKYASLPQWFTEIITEALKLQIDFPTSFLQFNRGRLFIENLVDETLAETREELKKSPDPKAQKAYEKLMGSFEVYMNEAFQGILKELRTTMTSFGFAKSESVVSFPSIVLDTVTKCGNILSRCYREGPSASLNKEIYPVVKNIYDVSAAVTKDLLDEEAKNVGLEEKE